MLHQNLRLKTSIFPRKIEKNEVFERVFPKICPIFPVFTELNLDFTRISGGRRLAPPGTPSIAPRVDHRKIDHFSTCYKNETPTKPRFYQKMTTKENTRRPLPPLAGYIDPPRFWSTKIFRKLTFPPCKKVLKNAT